MPDEFDIYDDDDDEDETFVIEEVK